MNKPLKKYYRYISWVYQDSQPPGNRKSKILLVNIDSDRFRCIHVDLGVFTIQADLGVFTHNSAYPGIFTLIQAKSGRFRNYSSIFRHIQNPV